MAAQRCPIGGAQAKKIKNSRPSSWHTSAAVRVGACCGGVGSAVPRHSPVWQFERAHCCSLRRSPAAKCVQSHTLARSRWPGHVCFTTARLRRAWVGIQLWLPYAPSLARRAWQDTPGGVHISVALCQVSPRPLAVVVHAHKRATSSDRLRRSGWWLPWRLPSWRWRSWPCA